MGVSVLGSNISKNSSAIEIFRGASQDVKITLTQPGKDPVTLAAVFDPVDLTGATLYFTMRKWVDSPTCLLYKTSVDSTQIEISSPATLGEATLHLIPGDTNELEAGEYVFDIWVQLASGKKYPVVEVSGFVIKQPVTLF